MIKISYNYFIQLDDQAWIVVIKYLVMDSMFWCNDFFKFLMTMSLYFISFWSFFPPNLSIQQLSSPNNFFHCSYIESHKVWSSYLDVMTFLEHHICYFKNIVDVYLSFPTPNFNPPMQMLNFHLKSFFVQQSSLTCEKIKHML